MLNIIIQYTLNLSGAFTCMYNEALSVHCVVEPLKYTNSKVLLDLRGHHFTQEDFDHITREHHDALDRIKEVDDYQHMIIFTLRGLP